MSTATRLVVAGPRVTIDPPRFETVNLTEADHDISLDGAESALSWKLRLESLSPACQERHEAAAARLVSATVDCGERVGALRTSRSQVYVHTEAAERISEAQSLALGTEDIVVSAIRNCQREGNSPEGCLAVRQQEVCPYLSDALSSAVALEGITEDLDQQGVN